MKPPDIVKDAQELRASQAVPNRTDMLNRARLPVAMGWMELELRDHPLDLATRMLVVSRQAGLGLLLSFVLTTLVIAPLGRSFGTGLFSPVTYPVICFMCGLAAYLHFTRTNSLQDATWRFILPQAVFVLLEWAFSPGIDRGWVVFPVAIAMFAVGYIADQINTHYVHWVTANLKLKREAALRRRDAWKRRFCWSDFTAEIRVLHGRALELEGKGKLEKAMSLRRQAGELCELRDYPLSFLVLFYFGALLFLGVSSTILVLAGFGFSLILALRRPVVRMKLSRLILEVIVHAFVSWFSWDMKQQWVHSPGVFRDGLSSRFRRITQTIGCFAMLQIAFIPSVHLWGSGQGLTPSWLWTAEYEFFLNLLLPVLMLASVLIATGARPLWLHLEAVEWCEVSDEIEKKFYWDAVVGRLLSSKNKLEVDHLYLGTHAEYGYPILILKWLLRQHMHIIGDSGSGKTSRILIPLIIQLIRAGETVIIVDLKGDRSELEEARRVTEACGRTFKLFTNELGKASHLFNPMTQMNSRSVSIAQFVETLMEALRLNHGDGYGSRFFSSQTRAWLLKTVKRFPNISSFEELYSKASPEFFKNDAEMDRCREAITVIEQIAQVTTLNWKPAHSDDVDQSFRSDADQNGAKRRRALSV